MSEAIPQKVLRLARRHFDGRTFDLGAVYAQEGRVTLVNDHWPAVARVSGELGYVTTVFNENRGQPHSRIHGECSCELSYDCKHVVATALVALTRDLSGHEAWEAAARQQAVGDWLTRMSLATDATSDERAERDVVLYILDNRSLKVCTSRRLKRGGYSRPFPMIAMSDRYRDVPRWVPDVDLRLIALLRAMTGINDSASELSIDTVTADVFEQLCATERLFWKSAKQLPLVHGVARTGRLCWRESDEVPGHRQVDLEGELELVQAASCHYVDAARGQLGELDVGASASVVRHLFRAPPVPPEMVETVGRSLRPILGDGAAAALVSELSEPRRHELRPSVMFSIDTVRGRSVVSARADASYGEERRDLAVWDPRRPLARDMVAEGRLREHLDRLLEEREYDDSLDDARSLLAEVRHVARRVVPQLREEGWDCELIDFPIDAAVIPDEWTEELHPRSDGYDWFDVEMGVVIEGRKVPLLPILLDMIRAGDLPLESDHFAERRLPGVNLELPDGHVVFVSGERLQRWLRPLFELSLRGLDRDDKLVVPGFVAVELAAPGRFSGARALEAARAHVASLLELEPRAEPPGFRAELRGYQRDGLAWLCFLHEAGYGGLLADDMGLGKTVQVLAFLQALRGAGDRGPALVVAPRSVVGHWRDEAARFAPDLDVVVHLGAKRSRDAEDLRGGSLVVTSYQTLLRDAALFGKVAWTTVLCDEAQALKNPKTKIRGAVAKLEARSRFCLTGTPIENHLGELWSQMDLVMPGLLGTGKGFSTLFRRSIEKYGNSEILELLRQRIRPFMLRRTKAGVDLDLPDKVEIVERVELHTEQQDLYESLRLSLDEDVRKALASKNRSGSSLTVLDALLKLRQVCCHPRLVNMPQAKEVTRSSKLDRLMGMLEELADAGRYVLVFSQFTSMLALIEDACREVGIGYLTLTGATQKRDQVVRAFQAGEAPVFLISLKAGGTGLNLTRADTVIHVDPWWNPAAEEQATDRAHRIGQDKKVFVYKLITAGTLEERMLEMQREKRALTDAALHKGGVSHLAATDLDALYRQLV